MLLHGRLTEEVARRCLSAKGRNDEVKGAMKKGPVNFRSNQLFTRPNFTTPGVDQWRHFRYRCGKDTWLRANLQFVLNDVLKTCTFVTADYLAEQYKIVFKDSLEIALQTCEEEDLFSFIQNEFADTFFVHKESEPRGLLRKNAVNKPLPVAQNAPRRAIDYEKSAGSPAPRAVEVDLDYDSGSQYSRPPRAELIIDQHITVPKEEPADFVEELRPGFANVGIGEMRSRSRSQSSKEGVATVPEVSADISLKNELSSESSVTVYIRQENAEIPRSSQLSPLSASIPSTSMPSSPITKLSAINCSAPTPPPDYIVQYDYVPILPPGIDHHLPNMLPQTLLGPGPIFRPPHMFQWNPSQGPSPNPGSFPPFVPLAARFPGIPHSFGVPPGIRPIHPGFQPQLGQPLISSLSCHAAPYIAPPQYMMNNSSNIRLVQFHQHPGPENQSELSRRERRPMKITTPPSSPSPPQEWGRTSSTWSTNGLPVIGRTDERQGGPENDLDPEESQVTIVRLDDPEGANVVLPDPNELPESIEMSEQDSESTPADNSEISLSQEKSPLLNLSPECTPESEEGTLEKIRADSDRGNDLELNHLKEFNTLSIFSESSARNMNVKSETSVTSNVPFQNLINLVKTEPKPVDLEMNAAIPMPGPASESFRKSLSVDTPPPGFEMPQKPPGFEMPKKPPGFEMLQKPPGFGMPQKPPGFDDVAPVRTPSVTSASNADVGENIEEASVRPASDEVPDDTAGLLKFLEDVNKKREENEREANNAENVRQTAEYIGTPNSPQNNTSSEDLREGSVRGDQTPDLVRTTKPYYDPDFEEDYDDVVAQNSPELNGYTVNDNAKNVRASSPKLSKSPESPAIKSKRVTEPHYKLVDGYIEIYDTIYRHKGQMENWENESIPLPWLNITNLGDVLAILRRLHKLYPEGCTAEELYQFDNTLRTFNEGNGHFSQISSLPSMALVIENGMLVVEAHELDQQVVHRFHVCPQALNIEIVQMRKNLCSNLYRVLRNNNGTLRVKDVMEYWNQLVLVPFGKSAETILKVCNRYPLVFQLKSNRTDEYCFETSSLCITEGLSDWRVVLDCEINDMPAILCDCSECV
ncbi:hypothetical protein DdX_10047 [Ditylenchus destructor]|uniref:Uncharacterized protein n=1 Tax=Ditylenchus destructor TaxID=166010 RepID=A0AAD4R5S5_9BILA|nr:hypothetical protein DdX_10047 [Ditylenchus destructor]